MAQILRDLSSPVTVTLTRPKSPAIFGNSCKDTYGISRTKSATSRYSHIDSRDKMLLGHDLNSRDRSVSPRRTNSARGRQLNSSFLLEVPSAASKNKNNQSKCLNDDKRSRSHSPLDWIHREKMPSCSPTFERVLCDMLSETELSPQTSDAENDRETRQHTKQKKSTGRRKRALIKRKS